MHVVSSNDYLQVVSRDDLSTNQDDVSITRNNLLSTASLSSSSSIIDSERQKLVVNNSNAISNDDNNNNNRNAVAKSSNTCHYYIDKNGTKSCSTILELHGKSFSTDEDAFNGYYTYVPEIIIESDDD
jgi:hypothetical protein